MCFGVLPIWLYRKAMSGKQSGKNPNLKNLSERAKHYFEKGEKYFEEKRFRPAIMAFVNAQKAYLEMLNCKEIVEKEKNLATSCSTLLQKKTKELIFPTIFDKKCFSFEM